MAIRKASDPTDSERGHNLYKSGKFVDFTINAKTRSFKGIDSKFSERSSFFEKALYGNFEEARTKVVDLSSWDDEVVEAMVQHLYTSFYVLPIATNNGSTAPSGRHHCSAHTLVYALGAYNEYCSLQESANIQFAVCMELDLNQGFQAASFVYQETGPENRLLKDTLVKLSNSNITSERYDIRILGDEDQFKDARLALRANPDFMYDLVMDRTRVDHAAKKAKRSKVSYIRRHGHTPCAERVACHDCSRVAYRFENEIVNCPAWWTTL